MGRPFSNSQVDRAGRILSSRISQFEEQELDDSLAMLSRWRAFHAYALNAVALTLKNRAQGIDESTTVSQRLKRLPSIQKKLMRSPNMALTQMQDIAGCRAVVRSIGDVFQLKRKYEQYYEQFPLKGSSLIGPSTKNYILKPKPDGYRGVHLVLKFRTNSSDAEHCNGLRIEVKFGPGCSTHGQWLWKRQTH